VLPGYPRQPLIRPFSQPHASMSNVSAFNSQSYNNELVCPLPVISRTLVVFYSGLAPPRASVLARMGRPWEAIHG